MLIDQTYFIAEINIAGTTRQEVIDTLNALVSKYEPIFLRDVLGIELSTLFVAGLTSDPIDQRYIDIRDGKVFQIGSVSYRWRGLIEGDSAITKKSIIANFIYYWYVRDVTTFQTPVGETSGLTQNSAVANPDIKMCRAWNEMVEGVTELVFFLRSNYEVYPEFANAIIPNQYFKKLNIYGI